jgi:hypothetical protein
MTAGRLAALLKETEQLAEQILAVAPPPAKPPPATGDWSFVTKEKIRIDPDDLVGDMHSYLTAERHIQAFFLAYSLQWFRHGRKLKRVPTDPEFLAFRDVVRARAIELVTACDSRMSRVMDSMADGEVMFPISAPEVRVSDLLAMADQRRMDAEQKITIDLVKGFVDQAASEERADVTRNLFNFILDYWRQRAARTTAIFDALSRKK